MKIKKLISVFLLLVMSIQLIPLQQIAAWLNSGRATEEIAHDINPEKGKCGNNDENLLYTSFASAYIKKFPALPSSFRFPPDETVFGRLADDIPTPPPNC